MRLGIVGSRDYTPKQLVARLVAQVPEDTILVLTGMPGPSRYAEECSRTRDMPRPDMFSIPRGTHSDEKFFQYCSERNEKLINACDVLVVFHGELDPNSRECMNMAQAANKPIFLIGCNAPQTYVDDLYPFIERAFNLYQGMQVAVNA